ncbi:uncharacterized relative of glutathione S-transferase [Plesiocystis pacifica SIR-1]|uniref:Uncharacterized relative of glutathione S-transferase n=1 Tax=Plesiocystis pacifica SIR-1 TaxID=391625 RepID=A6G7H2_9BACT|nr:MAPEG family protein [Plesiocystis pacifica]EDM78181.1 uncharacterized relative of glutathione S-transferase [Plesiocystis pacifica SIR-1]
MPTLVAAPLYAAILGLLVIVLAAGVIRLRRSRKVSLGSGGDGELEGRIRAHANLIEYAPITLLLLALFEVNDGNVYVAHAVGVTLVLGRVIHAWALPRYGTNPAATQGRVAGMILTFLALAAVAIANVAVVVLGMVGGS